MIQHSKPARLGIGIISAGRVGAVLGAALRACEHTIVGVHAVSEASQERAAMLLPDVPLLPVEQIAERSELLILAVPDDELPGLITYLASSGSIIAGRFLVHTSGVTAPGSRTGDRAGRYRFGDSPRHDVHRHVRGFAASERHLLCRDRTAPFIPIAQALVVEMGGEPCMLPRLTERSTTQP